MRRRTASSAAAILVLSCAPGSTFGEEKDPLRTRLETRVTWDGPLEWQGFGPGSSVEFRTTGAFPVETRETLVAGEGGDLVVRSETRRDGEKGRWKKGSDRPARIAAVPGAERRVERLGPDALEFAGGLLLFTKERWTRVVRGVAGKPELVVWAGADGVPRKWEEDLGHGIKTTFAVLREDVSWRVGTRTLRCREVRTSSVSTRPGLDWAYEATELWSDAVPGRLVRRERALAARVGPWGRRLQKDAFELTAFESR